MATTRIIAMHHNKGKTVAACLKARIDYAKNPDKTANGIFVTAYECDPRLADAQFLYAKHEYLALTGREQEHDVIAYQVRQSFKPGEIAPEEANRLGYEFAKRFLKGKHAFIVCTHVDKGHIHNHIIWNSTSLDCTRKFKDFWRSGRAVRKLSDTICVENGYSIVENPGHKGMHYGKWLGNNRKPSHREQLRAAVDTALMQKPKDILALLDVLKEAGYEIKPGKVPAVRGKGQKRFIRLDTLGEGYTIHDLQAVLDGKRAHSPRKTTEQYASKKPVSLLVDIQAALSAGKGAGYERWAKVFNLKQMAQTINYLTENGLLEYATLKDKADGAARQCDDLLGQIKTKEKRLAEIADLRANIIQYIKTREVYVAYRKSGYSKKFLAGHEPEIILHKATKKAFDSMGLKKLPRIAQLNSEYAELSAEKKKLYAAYRSAKEERRALLTAKANVDKLLGTAKPGREKHRDPQR